VAAGNTNADLDNAATVGSVIQGTYGKLTLNADGSYTYVRDAGSQWRRRDGQRGRPARHPRRR
ncbi:hypothetical protein EOA50_30520, partial [Mesorhizobium sp. M1A.F.Ca.IN.020.30.1.1]|uniref:VCBS domain-containing protein n=1 Tax=Mesorhizobium sp. M1A.F.Ca.IN.020.30.1.1 TaxID=2496762 RepID=UPI000FD47FF3